MSLNKFTSGDIKPWMTIHAGVVRATQFSAGAEGAPNPISLSGSSMTMTMTASENITKGQLLTIDGSDNSVKVMTATSEEAIGVADESKLMGEEIKVAVQGLVSVIIEAGETIIAGDSLRLSNFGDGMVEKDIEQKSTLLIATESTVGDGSTTSLAHFKIGENNTYLESLRGVASGLATLDVTGKVPASQLNLTGLVYLGLWNSFSNTPVITSSIGNNGEYYIVKIASTGVTTINGESTWQVGDYIMFSGNSGTGIWERVDNVAGVESVNTRTGAVVLDKTDVGLSLVDNTSDTSKPVSTLQQEALDLKANISTPAFTGDVLVDTVSPVIRLTDTNALTTATINSGLFMYDSLGIQGSSLNIGSGNVILENNIDNKNISLNTSDGVTLRKVTLDPVSATVKLVDYGLDVEGNVNVNSANSNITLTDSDAVGIATVNSGVYFKDSLGATASNITNIAGVMEMLNYTGQVSIGAGGSVSLVAGGGSKTLELNSTTSKLELTGAGLDLNNNEITNATIRDTSTTHSDLTISSIVHTDGFNRLSSVAPLSAYNKDFGTIAGTVAEGSAVATSLGSKVNIDGTSDMTGDLHVVKNNPVVYTKVLNSASSGSSGGITVTDASDNNLMAVFARNELGMKTVNLMNDGEGLTSNNSVLNIECVDVVPSLSTNLKLDKTKLFTNVNTQIVKQSPVLTLKNTTDTTSASNINFSNNVDENKVRVEVFDSNIAILCDEDKQINFLTDMNVAPKGLELNKTRALFSVDVDMSTTQILKNGHIDNTTIVQDGLTASQIVETDVSKKLVSVAKASAYNKDFGTTTGTIADGKVVNDFILQKGQPNGLAQLNSSGKIDGTYLSINDLNYQTAWNAATNTPPLSTPEVNGNWYFVSVSGTTNLSGITSWEVGDKVVSNGLVWEKIITYEAVQSVAGKIGLVSLDKTDVGLSLVSNNLQLNADGTNNMTGNLNMGTNNIVTTGSILSNSSMLAIENSATIGKILIQASSEGTTNSIEINPVTSSVKLINSDLDLNTRLIKNGDIQDSTVTHNGLAVSNYVKTDATNHLTTVPTIPQSDIDNLTTDLGSKYDKSAGDLSGNVSIKTTNPSLVLFDTDALTPSTMNSTIAFSDSTSTLGATIQTSGTEFKVSNYNIGNTVLSASDGTIDYNTLTLNPVAHKLQVALMDVEVSKAIPIVAVKSLTNGIDSASMGGYQFKSADNIIGSQITHSLGTTIIDNKSTTGNVIIQTGAGTKKIELNQATSELQLNGVDLNVNSRDIKNITTATFGSDTTGTSQYNTATTHVIKGIEGAYGSPVTEYIPLIAMTDTTTSVSPYPTYVSSASPFSSSSGWELFDKSLATGWQSDGIFINTSGLLNFATNNPATTTLSNSSTLRGPWFQLDCGEIVDLLGFTSNITNINSYMVNFDVVASVDGTSWNLVESMVGVSMSGTSYSKTFVTPATGVRYFRIICSRKASSSGQQWIYIPEVSFQVTHNSIIQTITDLDIQMNAQVSGSLDIGTTLTYGDGWKDLISYFSGQSGGPGTNPSWANMGNDLYGFSFGIGDALTSTFHVDHDYKLGSLAYPHVHFLSTTTETVGKIVTWSFVYTIAKGHQQGQSLTGTKATLAMTYTYTGTEVAGEHIIVESPVGFDLLEPDTMIYASIWLTNKTTVGSVFGICCDLHYQADHEVTLNKSPPFN